MANPTGRSRAQWPLTILILLEGLVLSLNGLHVIRFSWAVAAFFSVLIPFAALKAFFDLRRH
jgi:hypothetical protein